MPEEELLQFKTERNRKDPVTEIDNKQNFGEKYKNVHRPLGKMLYYNFFGGIAWGLGVLIGTTIIFAIIAFFVGRIDFVPIFGQFAARVIESAQINLQTP